ncbi:MAG: twin-arginine translocase TatA/TatE family subunit [Chloroflexi bacterium]|nr:twin-arginine translocase TatA/TatE family subunit [Chloroflexota bacterium]
MPNIGTLELLLLLLIVVLLFGVGRIARVGGEMGGACANFRKSAADDPATAPADDNR